MDMPNKYYTKYIYLAYVLTPKSIHPAVRGIACKIFYV